MATVLTDDSNYTAIAAAIREKNGSTDVYKPTEMAAAISALSSGSSGGALKVAQITTATNKIDISNYTKDKNFILFFTFDEGSGNGLYDKTIYSPFYEHSVWSAMTGYTYWCGGLLSGKEMRNNFTIGTKNGIKSFYGNSNTDYDTIAYAAIKVDGTNDFSYENGVLTRINDKYTLGTYATLIYIGEDDS